LRKEKSLSQPFGSLGAVAVIASDGDVLERGTKNPNNRCQKKRIFGTGRVTPMAKKGWGRKWWSSGVTAL